MIITGCSHSGICNIVLKAREVCKKDNILDIIGGLHLLSEDNEQLEATIDFFMNNHIGLIHPSHCTDLNSKIKLSKVAVVSETGSGLCLSY